MASGSLRMKVTLILVAIGLFIWWVAREAAEVNQ